LIRVLDFHAAWKCRHSGACCTAGWPIPIEPRAEERVRATISAGRLRLPPSPDASAPFVPRHGLPDGARCVVGQRSNGQCVFHDEDSRRCAIHRDLGEDALPKACHHFPRVALLGATSVSLSLSHYCPTAAALLFETRGPTSIQEHPDASPADRGYEGLDVRGALPPFLRPGVLTTPDTFAAFESRAVGLLANEPGSVDAAVARLVGLADSLAAWAPSDGAWEAFARARLHLRSIPIAPMRGVRTLWDSVVGAVPDAARRPSFCEPPPAQAVVFGSPDWALAPPLRRYLAAKLFAGWCAYQGQGLATLACLVEAALAVVKVECARGGGSIDAASLLEAIRRADLLIVHWADPQALARRLDAVAR